MQIEEATAGFAARATSGAGVAAYAPTRGPFRHGDRNRRRSPDHGRAFAFADGQNIAEPFVYRTENLPCKTVLAGIAVKVPCNAVEFYLGVGEVAAYCGQPLKDTWDGSSVCWQPKISRPSSASMKSTPCCVRSPAVSPPSLNACACSNGMANPAWQDSTPDHLVVGCQRPRHLAEGRAGSPRPNPPAARPCCRWR